TWRSDIVREVDLIEEVARVHGYSEIPTCRKIQIEAVAADSRHAVQRLVGTFLNACGFYETITVGFVDQAVADLFVNGESAHHLGVRDVSRKSANLLRQTLLGSLLGVLKTNVNARNLPCCIYEIADTFAPSAADAVLPREDARLALVTDGDMRQLRGAIEGLIRSLDRSATLELVPAEVAWAGVGARVTVNERPIGEAGIFSETIREKLGFKEVRPCGAELDFEALMALQGGPVKIQPIPRFPAIERDLSVVVSEETPWTDIARAVDGSAPAELEDVQFVDIYRGKGIPGGKKSVTLSLRFRDEDGTLTHETVDGYQDAIVKSLAASVGAELRAL
ncbi:MAG: hypothetical protein JW741_29425, partial [Sedimentisphaerales bacterium]|nr:hypothetical protein [Sedimentisphaerales bacterium]